VKDFSSESLDTVARAEAIGFIQATDFTEIHDFIDHNRALGSLWADYNPLYLRWLTSANSL